MVFFTILKDFYSNGKLDRFITGVICLILYTNIPFQWLINDGVMYGVSQLLCYSIFIILLINFILLNDSIYRLSIVIGLVFIISLLALMSFSRIIVITLFNLSIILYLVSSKWNLIFKIKYIKIFLCYSVISIFILLLLYLYILNSNGKSIMPQFAQNLPEIASGATYGNLKGGILYQILGFSDWSMYTPEPNRLFAGMNFNFHFYIPQLFTFLLLFFSILSFKFGVLNKKIMVCILFLFISYFLSKGNQEPLGSVFLFLVNNIPPFQSIRTPDTKFGVYSIATLLIISLYYALKNKSMLIKYIFLTFSLIYLTNSIPSILNGETSFGILDKNTENYSYTINLDSDINLIKIINRLKQEDIRGVLIPGLGTIDSPSGKIGFRDYLDSINSNLINYYAAFNGPFSDLLRNESIESLELWMYLRGLNFIVIRRSALEHLPNYLSTLSNNNSLEIIYSDKHSILLRKKKLNSSVTESNYIDSKLNDYIKLCTSIIYLINFLMIIAVLIIIYSNKSKYSK